MSQIQRIESVQRHQKEFVESQSTPKGYAYLLNEPIKDNVELNSKKEESKVLGAIAGGTAAAGIGLVAQKGFEQLPNKMKEFAEKVKVDDDLVNKILDETELSKKGVKLNNFAKSVPVALNYFAEMIIKPINEGKNAAYNPKNKSIMINLEKAGGVVFHEIGHAINANKSKFWKGVQKARPFAFLATIPLFLTALFKSKKAEGEKAVGFWDKTTTFIKENVGKLTTLAFIPIIAEELRATKVGNKLAKAVLKPEAYKNVVATNRIGAISYAAAAALAGFSAMIATKIRDKIATKE